MEKEPEIVKLYPRDFEKLGVQYTKDLICKVDPFKIQYVERNRLMQNLYGELLEQKYEAPLYLKFINKKIGYGVYADDYISKGDMIGEYAGELIHEQMFSELALENSGYCMDVGNFYHDESFNPAVKALVVDAKRCGNFTRFINHSYNPNTRAASIYGKDGLWHVIVSAVARIARDEQLTIDYGSDYWESRNRVPDSLNGTDRVPDTSDETVLDDWQEAFKAADILQNYISQP